MPQVDSWLHLSHSDSSIWQSPFRGKGFNRFLGWLMLPFGENSLIAYAIHVIICMVYIIVTAIVSYQMILFGSTDYFKLLA